MAGYIDLTSTISTPQPTFDGPDQRAVVWFDIDNTLYHKSTQIHVMMQKKIQAYFRSLGLDQELATTLHRKYYKEYGLAIRGLVRHHDINALEYDEVCDASLPLEDVLSPDLALRELLRSIDPNKARVLALTNAYKTHATRCLKLLGIYDLFEGLVFCDYGRPDGEFGCKPETTFFQQATAYAFPHLTSASSSSSLPTPLPTSPSSPSPLPPQYFVDDSMLNVAAALSLGFRAVHFSERGEFDTDQDRLKVDTLTVQPKSGEGELVGAEQEVAVISDLQGLREVWKELFV